MHHLVLSLGATQRSLRATTNREYQTADYFLPERAGDLVTTPFSGLAVAQLYPGRFDHLHLFGTRDSIWESLLFYCLDTLDASLDAWEDDLNKLVEAIGSKALEQQPTLLEPVGRALEQLTGIRTSCYCLPIGFDADERWDIFGRLTALPLGEADTVSIDITHGLRYHPLLMFLALAYFQNLHEDLTIASIFYAGLELKTYYEGRAPVFDLRVFYDLLEWMAAARAFRRYGDAGALAPLLDDDDALNGLLKRATYFARVLNLNMVGELHINARKLVKEIDRLDDDALPPPLRLLLPSLRQFPDTLTDEDMPAWKRMLKVSRHQYENGNTGLAVLAAWEAVIQRMAQVYYIEDVQFEQHITLGRLARQRRRDWQKLDGGLEDLRQAIRNLHQCRNAVAHADEATARSANQVAAMLPNLLGELERNLGHDALEDMPLVFPYHEKSTRSDEAR